MPKGSLKNFDMRKKYKVKIALSAQLDFRIIWDYISQNNPSNASVFISEIEKRILNLSVFPEKHPFIPEGDLVQIAEYRHCIHKKYRIIYRIQKDIVYILRIFHGSKLLDIDSL